MQALSVHALVIGAGISVIQLAQGIVYTNPRLRLAEILGAKVLVITILLYVETLPVYAEVVGTGNVVIQQAGGCKPTNTVYARIIRTGDIIITHLGRMDTNAVHTRVIGTGTGIGAVARGEYTLAQHTAVDRTQVVVITDDGRESA